MQNLMEIMNQEMEKAFVASGYDGKYARVTVSNRPDLCEFQCNGAMASAKQYKKNPLQIAEEVAGQLESSKVFASAEAAKPGFLNLTLQPAFLAEYLKMRILGKKRQSSQKQL